MRVIPIAGTLGARGARPGLGCGRGASGVDAVADLVRSDVLRPGGDEEGCFIFPGSWVDAGGWVWEDSWRLLWRIFWYIVRMRIAIHPSHIS